jgi:LssY C-terminus
VADTGNGADPPRSPKRFRLRHAAWIALAVIAAYGLLAYIILPALWTHHEHQKGLANLPMMTLTGQGIPGDAINVGLIGEQRDVVCAMHAAGWFPADPITLKSSIQIVGSVLLDRQYKDAPVSNLYYLGRREDLAFEKPVGKSADHRNHVRFWKVLDKGEEGRPVWLGDATFDRSVGVSEYTGAVTHHIGAERALLAADLETAGMVDAKYQVTGIGPTVAGRNGGGDPYYTDGEIWILRLVEACKKREGPAITIASPPATEIKDQIWAAVTKAFGK